MSETGLVLYHARTAVCAAKVRLVLAEKQLPFEGRLLDLQAGDQFLASYAAINPNCVVPTLVHNDAVIVESTVINEYLDDAFPQRSLRPPSPLDRARMRIWTKKEDWIHDAINTMTASIVFRHDLLKKPADERARRYDRMPDPVKRDKWRRMIEEGVGSSLVADALARFAKHFRDMEAALMHSECLVANSFSLADAGLVSFFFRLEMLGCAGLWSGYFPQVTRWFADAKRRSSFKVAILDPIPAIVHQNYREASDPVWPSIETVWKKAADIP